MKPAQRRGTLVAQRGPDPAAAARRARFGRLPEPIRREETVEERPATAPAPARHPCNADEWLARYGL
ncbi:hypothetical protein [Streptomyces sp. NPDC007883]|uniref:hypothetical protein n=1 Tax=Streptomyces sp. NPDC007883 TaxID=3155116 RepID=UPI00340E10F2